MDVGPPIGQERPPKWRSPAIGETKSFLPIAVAFPTKLCLQAHLNLKPQEASNSDLIWNIKE